VFEILFLKSDICCVLKEQMDVILSGACSQPKVDQQFQGLLQNFPKSFMNYIFEPMVRKRCTFDMSYLDYCWVVTGVGVNVFKFFGTRVRVYKM